MIVVKLIGGLGNQMFQYAAGKTLADKHHTELLIDTSYLNKNPDGAYTKRNLELNLFNVKAKIVTSNVVDLFNISKSNKITRVLQRNFPKWFKYLYAAESGNLYLSNFESYPSNTYLDGFWQSERYFISIRESLLKEFVPNSELNDINKSWLTQIRNSESISIHVRRGDYISNKNANTHHGVCDVEYYKSAFDFLKTKVNNINLFVFSDDLEWCKQNFKFDVPVFYVDANQTENAYLDMYLMSHCKHNIIANSSFSWWAAWLNQNYSKYVIAPKHWYANSLLSTKDLLPKEWIQL